MPLFLKEVDKILKLVDSNMYSRLIEEETGFISLAEEASSSGLIIDDFLFPTEVLGSLHRGPLVVSKSNKNNNEEAFSFAIVEV